MLFVELRFFLFFAIVFALVWTLRKNGQRKVVLTAASYIFYGVWDWRFLGLILFVTAVSYLVGTRFNTGLTDKRTQKRWLTLGVVTVLGVLGVFKYFNFFAESFADFAGLIGLPVGQITLSLVLPVGISFFTFQAISYMVDAYRGDIPAKRSFLDIAFYIAFFPQLVAGPIVRASDFIPQMETARRWADVGVRAALILFLIGFIKKACISDNIAPYVDMVFANPESFTAPAMIGGVLLYAVQIYCDFSGYSDMAIALAALLGYKFPQNFASPYLSPDIQDFWRRWHISLSSWLRDYLYIPLGGNRNGNMRRNINLMTTMLLGGLWHGASFNFVIWGGLHGGALIVERQWNKHVASRLPGIGFLGALMGTVVTFYWVNLAWIFFRAGTLEQSLDMAKTYLTWQSVGTETLPIPVWPILGALGLIHWLSNRVDANEEFTKLSPNTFALAFGAMAAVALAFVPLGYRPFIYFQF
jgi:D-alanyl-lipoteichoic acid acyltransferase DltB (MBOAT superfamily)